MNILGYIAGAVGAGLLLVGSLFGIHQQQQPISYGATNAGATPLFDTVLTQQLGTSDTTMYLKSVTDSQGNVLSGFQCFTIDVNSPSVEYVCGTISGKTVTGLIRNLSYQTGTTTYATPTNIHRVGADVRITDFPALTILNNQASGKDTFPNLLNYTYSPDYTNASSTAIASKGYVDATAFAGAPNADDSTKGIVQTATNAQASAGTEYGSTGARLALGANIATSTCQVAQNSVLVSSSTSGKLDPGCIGTGNYSFTGTTTLATSTVASSTVTTLHTTTLTVGGISVTPKFGGTGADGALSISSGTTTLTGAVNGVLEKDYTSISVTGTANLTFSGATTIILKSQNGCTFTTSGYAAYLIGMGGGIADGHIGADVGIAAGGGGGGGGGGGAMGSAGGENSTVGSTALNGAGGTGLAPLASSSPFALPGGNGGAGSSAHGSTSGGGGSGGTGGGGLYIECGGAYNFTTGTITARGTNGGNGGAATYNGGGGGGGGGGSVLVRYGSLTADTGTYTLTGGSGGLAGGSGAGSGANGANGQHLEVLNTTNY